MILVIIDNKSLLCRIINYFDNSNIKYTTDINDDYDYLLVSDINSRIISLIKDNIKLKKKIIFIAYLEEVKIFKNYNLYNKQSLLYKNNLYSVLNMCFLVVVSLPFFKQLLSHEVSASIQIVEREIPYIEVSKKKGRLKKIITCIDPNYENIDSIFKLAIKNPKYLFQILGYVPDYELTNKIKAVLHNNPRNIRMIRYYDRDTYTRYCKNNAIVVYFDDNIENIDYLYYIFLLKRVILIKNSELYKKYLINSKNAYLFDDFMELDMKLNKILNNRVGNLTHSAYELINGNNFDKICIKFRKYLR